MKAIGCLSFVRTAPIPSPKASHSTQKVFVKSGREHRGSCDSFLEFMECFFGHGVPFEVPLFKELSERLCNDSIVFDKFPVVPS